MRHLAITGMETAAIISRIFLGEAIRATPPSARICAGTRSRAITETAPAFSAITACSAFVTSMMTPPLSISARPVFRRKLVELPLFCDMMLLLRCNLKNRLLFNWTCQKVHLRYSVHTTLGVVGRWSLAKVNNALPEVRGQRPRTDDQRPATEDCFCPNKQHHCP